jgi:hypothetical protein
MGVDDGGRVVQPALLRSIVESFALVFAARRSLRSEGTLFSDKEYGRFSRSLRQTAATLRQYAREGGLKAGVKYHLDVLMVKVLRSNELPNRPSFVPEGSGGNLFQGWIGTMIRRALHRRDIQFIYSIQKGCPQGWAAAPADLVFQSLVDHRNTIGRAPVTTPSRVLSWISRLSSTIFQAEVPSYPAQFFSLDGGEPGPEIFEDLPTSRFFEVRASQYENLVHLETIEDPDVSRSRIVPTGRSCRQVSRGDGGKASLFPRAGDPTSKVSKVGILRDVFQSIVDHRAQLWASSWRMLTCGVVVQHEQWTKQYRQEMAAYTLMFGLSPDSVTRREVERDFGSRVATESDREVKEKSFVASILTERFFVRENFPGTLAQEKPVGSHQEALVMNACKVVPLCEAGLKIRVITVGDGPRDNLLQPIQSFMLGCWKSTSYSTMKAEDSDLSNRVTRVDRSFRDLISGSLTLQDYLIPDEVESSPRLWFFTSKEKKLLGKMNEDEWLELFSSFSELFGPEGDDRVDWMSGDYKAATDNLNPDTTLTAIAALRGHNAALARASFLPGKVSYPPGYVEDPDCDCAICLGADPGEGCSRNQSIPPVLLRNGQLMGHPLSFPLLCVINLATFMATLESWLQGDDSLHRKVLAVFLAETVMINGDDIATLMPQTMLSHWQLTTRSAGLLPSPGKCYFSYDCVQINSQLFRRFDGGMRRQEYLNQRLTSGVSVKTGFSMASPTEIARELSRISLATRWVASTIPIAMARWSKPYWSMRVNKTIVKPNWYLPVHLGGVGLSLDLAPPQLRITRAQRLLAALFVHDVKNGDGLLSLYRLTGGQQPLSGLRLLQRILPVAFLYGDGADQDPRLRSDQWLAIFSLLANYAGDVDYLTDMELVRCAIPENWRLKPMTKASIFEHWTMRLFRKPSGTLPPVPPFPPLRIDALQRSLFNSDGSLLPHDQWSQRIQEEDPALALTLAPVRTPVLGHFSPKQIAKHFGTFQIARQALERKAALDLARAPQAAFSHRA